MAKKIRSFFPKLCPEDANLVFSGTPKQPWRKMRKRRYSLVQNVRRGYEANKIRSQEAPYATILELLTFMLQSSIITVESEHLRLVKQKSHQMPPVGHLSMTLLEFPKRL